MRHHHRKYMAWAAPWRVSGSGRGLMGCGITRSESLGLLSAEGPIRWLPCGRCIGLGYLPGSMVWVGEDQTSIEHTRDICLGCLGVCWVVVGL